MPIASQRSGTEVAAVHKQLRRMLASAEYQNSERMSRFLRYVVELSLAGDDAALKESTIGVAVFDRAPGYNPKTDPVVRSEARRLREKIDRYYTGPGSADPVRIHVPKGGYVACFEFPTVSADEPVVLPDDGATADQLASLPRTTRRIRFWMPAALLGLIGCLLTALALHRATPAASRFIPGRVSPLTSLPGLEMDASISPDGRQVAFIWDHGTGDFDIYTMGSDGGRARQLTTTPERELHPAFSPDGRRIAFLKTSPAGIEVWSMAADGSGPGKLTEIRWFEWFNWKSDPLLSASYPGPAWTPDGRSLILSDVAGSQQGAALWEFDIATKARRQLSRPQNLSHDFYPAVSPDGRRIAFARQFSASASDLYLLDRSTGAEMRVTRDAQEIRGLAWMPNGKALIYSSARSGVLQLWQIAINGDLTPLPTVGNHIAAPAVSRDGRLLVYANTNLNVNLWRQPLDGSTPPEPLIQSTGSNLFPRYSPDGRRIAWASDRTGGWEIWAASADGSRQQQLTHLTRRSGGRMLGTPRWSPDGSLIAFDARLGDNCAIYVVPSLGGPPRLLEQNSYEERNPSFSTDGRWIYFNSNRGGAVQIWRRPVDGGPPVRVTSRRGYDAMESADGKEVYFLPALAEPGIWRVARDGSDERVMLPTVPYWSRRHWAPVRDRIYFVGHDAEPRTLFRITPTTLKIERVTALQWDLIADIASVSVSPDERWLVLARPDLRASDLVAVRPGE